MEIDACVSSRGSEFDVARVAAVVLHGDFRYIGDRQWERREPTGAWTPDPNGAEMRTAIRLRVKDAILERAYHWQESAMTAPIEIQFDYHMRASELLRTCIKLSRDVFLRKVVRECQPFFIED